MRSSGTLADELVGRLRTLHAVKAGALRMFDPMLEALTSARDGGALPEVEDLLGRMHSNFSGHREATARHVDRLGARIVELGGRPANAQRQAIGLGGALRARVAAVRGMNFGSAATEAFVFEHLEIAQAQLAEQLAERTADEQTATALREVRADDEEMAATIGRNWTNVLSLSLATKALPVLRPPEEGS